MRAFLIGVILLVSPVSALAVPLEHDDAGSGRDAGNDLEGPVRVTSGAYHGRLSSPTDVEDRYVFSLEAGARFLLQHEGAVRLTVLRPDGVESGSWEHMHGGTMGGDWTLVVDGGSGAYRFVLRIEDLALANDAGSGRDAGDSRTSAIRVGDGTITGLLTGFDAVDRFEVPLSTGETLTADIDVARFAGVFFEVYAVETDGNDDRPERHVLTATKATWATITVSKYWGEDADLPYTLTLQRAGGLGDEPEPLRAVQTVASGWEVTALLGLPEGGVEAVRERELVRVDAAGVGPSVPLGARANGAQFVRDSEGDITYLSHGTLREEGNAGVGLRLAGDLRDLAFGPDGSLYAAAGDRLVRLGADGAPIGSVATGGDLRDIAFTPQGTLYAIHGYDVARIDPATGVATPVSRSFSFDGIAADALGRVYYHSHFEEEIRRYDPAADVIEVVAVDVPLVRAMAFGADALYVAGLGAQGEPYVARVDVGVPGFTGFRGPLALPLAADLTISSFRQEDALVVESPVGPLHPGVAETRTFVVDVTNVGAGPAEGPFTVQVYDSERTLLSSGPQFVAEHPGPLAPGETATFRFSWDTTRDVGAQHMVARVAGGLESDAANNVAYLGTYHVLPVHAAMLV